MVSVVNKSSFKQVLPKLVRLDGDIQIAHVVRTYLNKFLKIAVDFVVKLCYNGPTVTKQRSALLNNLSILELDPDSCPQGQ